MYLVGGETETQFAAKYTYSFSPCVWETLSEPAVPERKGISLYPNPASGILNVASDEGIHTIAINDVMGRTLFTHEYNSRKIEIAVNSYPPGVYYIKVNGTDVKQFVKE